MPDPLIFIACGYVDDDGKLIDGHGKPIEAAMFGLKG